MHYFNQVFVLKEKISSSPLKPRIDKIIQLGTETVRNPEIAEDIIVGGYLSLPRKNVLLACCSFWYVQLVAKDGTKGEDIERQPACNADIYTATETDVVITGVV